VEVQGGKGEIAGENRLAESVRPPRDLGKRPLPGGNVPAGPEGGGKHLHREVPVMKQEGESTIQEVENRVISTKQIMRKEGRIGSFDRRREGSGFLKASRSFGRRLFRMTTVKARWHA